MKHVIIIIICLFAIRSSCNEKYGVIISGGGNANENFYGYYDSSKRMHEALCTLGVNRNNITTLYADGIASSKNTKLAEKKLMKLITIREAHIGSVPFSFKGDSIKDIKYPADESSIEKVFYDLSKKMKDGDKLTLFITDHGDETGGIVIWNNKGYSVEKLKTQLEKLPKKATVQIVTTMCFGGQFFQLTSDNVCVVANSDDKTRTKSADDDNDFVIGFTDAIIKLHKTRLIEAFSSGRDNDSIENTTHLTSVDYFVNTIENPSAITCDNKENCKTWTQNFKGIPSSVILADIDDYLSKTDKKNDSKYEKYFRQKLEQIKKDLKISKNEKTDIMLAKTKDAAKALKSEMRRFNLNIPLLSKEGKKAIQECYDSCILV